MNEYIKATKSLESLHPYLKFYYKCYKIRIYLIKFLNIFYCQIKHGDKAVNKISKVCLHRTRSLVYPIAKIYGNGNTVSSEMKN